MTGTLTLEEVEASRRVTDASTVAAVRQVLRETRGWNYGDAKLAQENATELLMVLLDEYGAAAAAGAAAFAEDIWDASGGRGLAPVTIAATPTAAALRPDVSWAAKKLYGANIDPTNFQTRLKLLVDREVRRMSNETVTSLEEPRRAKQKVRYQRVPAATCCAFCSLIASRGAVFREADTAKTHAYCRCAVVPVLFEGTKQLTRIGSFDASGEFVDYDAGDHYEIYQAAAEKVGSRDVKALLAEMRKVGGIR